VSHVVVSCTVESAKNFVAARAARTARATFGAPFDASARSFAFSVHDTSVESPVAVLLMTIAGGVAALDELVVEISAPADVADALVARFEETASYHNCHKACALVKRDGAAAATLARAGYRVAAIRSRHFFQTDFVDVEKWLQ
jgi:hypothetical protein